MTGPQSNQGRSAITAERERLAGLLSDGVATLGFPVDARQQGLLLDYLALLSKWNSVYNLTAIRDPQQMLIQHVLDSLAIIPHLAGLGASSALDVGTGGGLPGMVMAIVLPDWRITLK